MRAIESLTADDTDPLRLRSGDETAHPENGMFVQNRGRHQLALISRPFVVVRNFNECALHGYRKVGRGQVERAPFFPDSCYRMSSVQKGGSVRDNGDSLTTRPRGVKVSRRPPVHSYGMNCGSPITIAPFASLGVVHASRSPHG